MELEVSTTRKCGNCQLCCTLLPIREISKAANARCRFQKFGKGCTIYDRRPMSCRTWSCVWLAGNAPIGRPDRTHYVVDSVMDLVARTEQDGSISHHKVVQVWCDPKHRDAHRDPALRAYLATLPTKGLALVRWGSHDDGMLLVPPALNGTKEWQEVFTAYTEHLPEEKN